MRLVFAASLAILLGPTATAQYLTLQVAGSFQDGRLGSDVADVGDIDGDGVPDFVSGAPYVEVNGRTAGQALVFSGASGAVLHELYHAVPSGSSRFGTSVAGLGDVDGDGIGDILVGDPQGSYLPGHYGGTVTVFSGVSGLVIDTLDAPRPGGQFGSCLAALGDIDGDSVPDFVVGAPRATISGLGSAGEAYVISGATGLILQVDRGLQLNDYFGAQVGSVGDVDGDSVEDWYATGPLVEYGTLQDAGLVRIRSGRTGAVVHELRGTLASEQLGDAVQALGDLDGDGYSDFAVSTSNWSSRRGRVQVYSGRTLTVLWEVTGTAIDDRIGSMLANGGDLDGDGVSDLVVSSTYRGIVQGHSGRDGSRLFAMSLSNQGLSGVGDLDGDGYNEFLVGEPSYSSSYGRVSAFSLVGVPAGGRRFGTGCGDAALGLVPSIGAWGGDATSLGNPDFAVRLANAPPAAPAFLVVGLSHQSWLGVSLPWRTFLGNVGCSLLVSFDLFQSVSTTTGAIGTGHAVAPVAIPADPNLASTVLHFQWMVLDPSGTGLLPAAMSRGLQVLVL